MAKEKEFKISLTGMTQGYITAETEEQAVKQFLRQLIITTDKNRNNGKFKPFKEIKRLYLEELEESYNE